MKIVLIRHGKPAINSSVRVSAAGFGEWISTYDLAGIDVAHRPSIEALAVAKTTAFTVCSHLPRSVESAYALKIETPDVICNTFRECEMPYQRWSYPKLPMMAWATIFRLSQLVGCSSNAESLREIKARSQACAAQLVAYAEEHGSVMFVGHGALNWFIHQQLKQMGWGGPRKAARNYWGFGLYSLDGV